MTTTYSAHTFRWLKILWIRVFYGILIGGLNDGRRPAGATGLTQFRPSVALRLLGEGAGPSRRLTVPTWTRRRAMADGLIINGDGTFEVDGHSYRIPSQFSSREVFSYRRLLEPIPDIPGGTTLTMEQRTAQKAYLFRRAASCVIPGLEPRALESLSLTMLTTIHRWMAAHRPDLTVDARMSA